MVWKKQQTFSNRWQSMVVNGHVQQSLAINGSQLSSMVICCYTIDDLGFRKCSAQMNDAIRQSLCNGPSGDLAVVYMPQDTLSVWRLGCWLWLHLPRSPHNLAIYFAEGAQVDGLRHPEVCKLVVVGSPGGRSQNCRWDLLSRFLGKSMVPDCVRV